MTLTDDARERDAAIPDLDWRVFPAGTVRDQFDAPSGKLARVSLGSGARGRVVLFPGVTGSKEDFTLMLPLLAEAGYRVEAYDLAGQYESRDAGPENLDPPRTRYDYPLFIEDLTAVLENGASAHVLGYSFAGLVSQLIVAERPELFATLTLLSTPPATGQVFRGVKRIGRFSSLAGPRSGASLLLWGIRNNLNRVPPQRIAFVRERFALTRRESVDDIVGLMMRMPDVADAVRAASVPTLVATGAHDLWPTEQYVAYARRIGAQVAVYETGHSPCETAPHQLVRDMLAMFAEVDGLPDPVDAGE
ncbi:MAG: alpha/beta hydrolase [Microbacterium sp.]|uniref:alpha/beta fold hydrolase n=1 Tax=Microbacterium sp. TaxID=51671 RepID=UPI000EC07952|nr:alpha/beta hydrolase [Microbacterium sp.]HCM50004.1 alpha/beta hydrolase [Microbacterium sp.]|tara:strand:- start:1968 stop:2882 length:915 start_codon:yes stop_codon:yes gene_type:complete